MIARGHIQLLFLLLILFFDGVHIDCFVVVFLEAGRVQLDAFFVLQHNYFPQPLITDVVLNQFR
jgi:hypothetical protein